MEARMSMREYVNWIAYYRLQAEREERARKRERNTAVRRRR